ncbi:MAG: hypothetical protein OXG65_10475 [Chloroflexi bacterium]|nr:hypothetical protein [Chloroflexota bacterium]
MLEHRYGALVLSHMLTGDPVQEVGDDATITTISFQAGAESAVDDLVIEGQGADGETRHASVAVRRRPRLIPSDQRSIELAASFLSVLTERRDDVEAGRWRLVLASTPISGVRELAELTEIARATPDTDAFRRAIRQPGRTTQRVRNRLKLVEQILERATQNVDVGDVAPPGLSWLLLRSLTVRELRLESPDESDRTAAVGRLRRETREQTPAEADGLFSALEHLASRYVPQGAQVDRATLRRDLVGSAELRRSGSHREAWGVLDRLSERLRGRTRRDLVGSSLPPLELDRAEATASLVFALKQVGAASSESSSALVIAGEPDVGKSALTIRSCETIRNLGGAVVCISLRDLPATTVDTEHVFEAPIREVLAGTEVCSVRLLVVDGAEAVLEGRRGLFTDVVTSALIAGLGVAAVTRNDGAGAVLDSMRIALGSAGRTEQEPARHNVEALIAAEVAQIAEAFPALSRVAQDHRSIWLLRRPGLADVLLRANPAITIPHRLLSEADVFAAVWWSRVRRGEELTSGGAVTPDERENALLGLVRRILVPATPPDTASARALPSLRSDGLLLAAGQTAAWGHGDDFTSDLLRDFALARLLEVEGCAPLQSARAPRWALRAARLACQAALAQAGETSEQARRELQANFDQLAADHGDRWAELPLEATLLLGDVLARAWPALQTDRQQELTTLLRIARQRYVREGVGEPAVLAPLVELICQNWPELRESSRYAISSEIQAIILEWLRGLIWQQAGSDPLRARLRDMLLERSDNLPDDFEVEALALLGPDLNNRAERQLRNLAAAAPSRLAPSVEPFLAVISLARRSPELLAELTEAYYIKLPVNDGRLARQYHPFDDGVRDHHRPGSSLGSRMADWHYGPFWHLLAVHPRSGLRTINRILDHAARARADQLRRNAESSLGLHEGVVEYELNLPGVGRRRCVGDDHVWRWYRGSAVGPRPCMSALLAVERVADAWIAKGHSLDSLVRLLVADCHNLAMPGLAVGVLIRHPDLVTDELDIWLAQPDAWSLEFRRLANEGRLHTQGPDADDVAGRDLRRSAFTQVAARQVAEANLEDNEERISALRECGQELMRRARSSIPGLDPDDTTRDHEIEGLITVANWATAFDRDNFRYHEMSDGQVAIRIEAPPGLRTARQHMDAKTVQAAKYWHLLNAYACAEDRRSASSTIRDDLSLAQNLVEDPPPDVEDYREGPAAVAASAVLAHADGTITLSTDELRWSAELLMSCAVSPRIGDYDFEDSLYLMGADRSAAAALPALLVLSARNESGAPPLRSVEQALRASTTSRFHEVRRITATALPIVWTNCCIRRGMRRRCVHSIALRAVEAGIRDCRLGPWNSDGCRDTRPIAGRVLRALDAIAPEDLVLSRLAAPIIATSEVDASCCCVREAALELAASLLDAHARGTVLLGNEISVRNQEDHHYFAARALFTLASRGNVTPLVRCLGIFAGCYAPLGYLLEDFSRLATYDDTFRASLPNVWPIVMRSALDAFESEADSDDDGYHRERVLAHMLPYPIPSLVDLEPSVSLDNARVDWIHPSLLEDLVARWIPLARGIPSCVDSAIELIQTASPTWQASVGLRWIDDLANGATRQVAGPLWLLPDWLKSLRSGGHVDSAGQATIQRIVDRLATHGDRRAVGLQIDEE